MHSQVSVKYIKYSKRVFKTLAGLIMSCLLYSLIIFFSVTDGIWAIVVVDVVLVAYGAVFILPTCKYYLTELLFDEQEIRVVYYEYDKLIETSYRLADLKIRLFEPFVGVLKFGRNYQLIVEKRQEENSSKFKQILNQSEVGEWTLQKFKDLFKIYKECKGEIVALDNVKRQNF